MNYAVFLRFTLAGTSYAWGSCEAYRSSQWHDGVLTSHPSPQEAWPNEFGLLPIQSFDVDVGFTSLASLPPLTPQPVSLQDEAGNDFIDEAGNTFLVETDANLIGTDAVLELVRTEDATEHVLTKTCVITAYRVRPGILTMTLADLDSVKLDTLYPAVQFTTTDFPELFTEHVGRPVPHAVGTAIKVPLTYIANNGAAGPWTYAACETPASVLTVYRDGRIVASTEYSKSSARTPSGVNFVTLIFALEQTDTSGKHYDLSADMQGEESRNAATELSRVMGLAGLSMNASSLAVASAIASAARMTVDCRYAEQRAFRGIVDDLALILRGHISRDDAGAYRIVQDVSVTSSLSLDESAGDLAQIDEMASPAVPAYIELSYKPSPADPTRPTHTLRRYTGGTSGAQRFEALYLSDHEAADRLACYLALRASYGQRLRARVYGQDIALGNVVTLTNPFYWSGARDWRVTRIAHPAAGADMELLENNAAVYVYTSAPLPADVVTGYQPDYSETPPDAPTGLTIVSSGAVAAANSVTAWVSVKATPPAANWIQMWFEARNDSTAEVYQVQGTDNGDGTWGAVIPGLRPNVAHHIRAWAASKTGVQGEVTSTTHTSATTTPVQVAIVSTGAIANNAVGTTQLANSAVSSNQLAANTINTGHINNSQITSLKRQDANVATDNGDITAGTVGGFTVTHNLGRNVVATAYSSNTYVIPFAVPNDSNSFYVYGYNVSGITQNVTLGAWYW